MTPDEKQARWEHIHFDWWSGLWDLMPEFLIENDCTMWHWCWRGMSLEDRPDV